MLTEKQKETSVRKWIGISHGRTRDYAYRNCLLCKEFDNPDRGEEDECMGCPIYVVTGISGCIGGTYFQFGKVMRENSKGFNDLVTENDEKVAALHEALFVYGAIDEVLGWNHIREEDYGKLEN